VRGLLSFAARTPNRDMAQSQARLDNCLGQLFAPDVSEVT
jgi:hypothetical protein